MFMKRGDLYLLALILILFIFSLWVILPGHAIFGRSDFQLGLDLKGGTHLVYSADLSQKDPSLTDAQAMASVQATIERRINAFGVTEPLIQVQGTRLVVDLPGVKDINQALKLIGQVALLEIKEEELDSSGSPVLGADGKPQWVAATALGSDGVTEEALTGKYLKPNSQIVLAPQTNAPEVSFQWDSEGAVLFSQITQRNLNKPIAIYLDNTQVEVATVQAQISDKGVITNLKLDEARVLVIQLNSGSLEAPLTVIQRTDVDATLGADSLMTSLRAGIIGIAIVIMSMLVLYRTPGALACLALIIYGALVLAIFKLVPVTLTLPGIAGFIISVGMAVDANVLIFERLKEELRNGRTLHRAVDEGFRRAWPSIRDSNISTFITCGILYWLGSTFGAFMVKGFALTLFLGVAVSMFSAVTITRTFMSLIIGGGVIKGLGLMEAKRDV
jgi:preprotein translocase subunit SecD